MVFNLIDEALAESTVFKGDAKQHRDSPIASNPASLPLRARGGAFESALLVLSVPYMSNPFVKVQVRRRVVIFYPTFYTPDIQMIYQSMNHIYIVKWLPSCLLTS